MELINQRKTLSGLFKYEILSIDLDFLTNNLIIDSEKGMIQTNPFKFKMIKNLIDKYRDKVKVVSNHGIIAKFILDQSIQSHDLFITNIDHHHDIYYSIDEFRDVLRDSYYRKDLPEYSLENCWISWVANTHNVVRVDEILNENSVVDRILHQYGFRFHYEIGTPIGRPYGLDLYDRKFDMIVVATSPSYTTPEELSYVLNYLGLENNEVITDVRTR